MASRASHTVVHVPPSSLLAVAIPSENRCFLANRCRRPNASSINKVRRSSVFAPRPLAPTIDLPIPRPLRPGNSKSSRVRKCLCSACKCGLCVCVLCLCLCACRNIEAKCLVTVRRVLARPPMFPLGKSLPTEFLNRSRRKVLSTGRRWCRFSERTRAASADRRIDIVEPGAPPSYARLHATFSCTSKPGYQPLNSRLNLHGDATRARDRRRRPMKKPVTTSRTSR